MRCLRTSRNYTPKKYFLLLIAQVTTLYKLSQVGNSYVWLVQRQPLSSSTIIGVLDGLKNSDRSVSFSNSSILLDKGVVHTLRKFVEGPVARKPE